MNTLTTLRVRSRQVAVAGLLAVTLAMVASCTKPSWIFGYYDSRYMAGEDRDILDEQVMWNHGDKTLDSPNVRYQYLEGGYTIWSVPDYRYEDDRSNVLHQRVYDPYGNELTDYSVGTDPHTLVGNDPDFEFTVKRDQSAWNRRRAQDQQQRMNILQQRPPTGTAVPRPPVPSGAPPATHRGHHSHRGG